jgi:hypothetical protein
VLLALLERDEVRGAAKKWDREAHERGGGSGWMLADVWDEFWDERRGKLGVERENLPSSLLLKKREHWILLS